jgi:hypothetical protein
MSQPPGMDLRAVAPSDARPRLSAPPPSRPWKRLRAPLLLLLSRAATHAEEAVELTPPAPESATTPTEPMEA